MDLEGLSFRIVTHNTARRVVKAGGMSLKWPQEAL